MRKRTKARRKAARLVRKATVRRWGKPFSIPLTLDRFVTFAGEARERRATVRSPDPVMPDGWMEVLELWEATQ